MNPALAVFLADVNSLISMDGLTLYLLNVELAVKVARFQMAYSFRFHKMASTPNPTNTQ
jgi:hypothetical protein